MDTQDVLEFVVTMLMGASILGITYLLMRITDKKLKRILNVYWYPPVMTLTTVMVFLAVTFVISFGLAKLLPSIVLTHLRFG